MTANENTLADPRLGQADVAFQTNLYSDPNPSRRWLHQIRHQWVHSALSRFAPAVGAEVLEVGVGCGTYTQSLSNSGFHVLAVDINEPFLRAVAGLPGVETLLCDATEGLPYRDVPLALCSEVLEHVPPSRSVPMLQAIYDALAPGGHFVLTTPQAFSTMEIAAGMLRFKPVLALARRLYGTVDELGHINCNTRSSLRRQIRQVGFEIVERDTIALYIPVLAEFGGSVGQKIAALVERIFRRLPLLCSLLWTQTYVLRKPGQRA